MFFYFEEPLRWKKVEYSRSQIIKAGKTVKKADVPVENILNAIDIIDNWRAAHAYPLHVMYMHLRRMANNRSDIIVAERLKRLESIIMKLRREPNMSLWMMQDLGGCRFIVPTIEEVYCFARKYQNSRIRHKLVSEYDYINNPKVSGYRSLHLVYEYHSDKQADYNRNMLIELQFRTHLQHLWATAVETMGLFTKQSLKSGQGDEDIKRFFVLVSSLFALREGMPVVPGTLADEKELISELEEIDDRRHFVEKLDAMNVIVEYDKADKLKKQGYVLLVLNYSTHRLRVVPFLPSQYDQANELYSEIEATSAETNSDAVLVRVSSYKSLKSAYPNYFSDIGEFVNILKSYFT